MNLTRYIRRLSEMSLHEVYIRSRQEALKCRDVLLYRLGTDPSPRVESGFSPRGRFFCEAADAAQIVDLIARRMPEVVEDTVASARRIVEHRFDLLGYQGLDFGSDIDWSLDPVHGRRAPSSPWPTISYLDFSAVGDHKIVWELNRHQILVTLARAYRFTGEERFAATLKDLWHDWLRKNSYPFGINWASSLEVALRAISWVWAGFLLEGTPADSPAFQQELARELARAGWYIDRFLSTYFSPNTHLLGEGFALFLIGHRYPALRGADRWAKTGWEVIQKAAVKQVREDGMYFEQSTYYHVYALDFFLHSRIFAARHGIPVSPELDRTIRGMLSSLAALSQAGALPRFGDDDGGRLFNGARNLPSQMRDPLSTGAALYCDPEFKNAAALSEETLWLLGPDGAALFDAVPASPLPSRPVELAESGFYAMASSQPYAAQLFIRAGERNAAASGHGHAEALSLQLAANGHVWLADPGTCSYVGGQRKRFRGTAAHSTLTVDALDQAETQAPFSWGPPAQVHVRRWTAGPAFDLFEASHSGYERLPSPVTHRRLVLRWGEGFWLVRDLAVGLGTHRFDIRWHFHPSVAIETRIDAVVCRRSDETLSLIGTADSSWELTTGTEAYSPAYGTQVPAPFAMWSADGSCPAEFAVVIVYSEAGKPGTLRRVDSASSVVGAYEYRSSDERRLFFLGNGSGHWSSGEWASDAAMLCLQSTGDGRRALILAGGSYVEYAGRRAVQAGPECERLECLDDGTGWRVLNATGDIYLNPDCLPYPG